MASHDGASSSSSLSSFTYDVFLSFRGPDTGDSFTAFLHKHLVKEWVNVYMDREDMRPGEEIKSALFEAIQGSKIAIPVFSKGYADSRWCLDELVEIVRCHRENGQIILPIFFDVDPKDVRHQTGSFETSFDKHKDKDRFDEQTINSWKEALEEVAKILGYDLGKVTGNQSKLVDLVVERVLSESSGKRLDDVKNPVGLNARVKEVEDRLCIGLDDVQFVGIWGTGGIGKTTIAKTLYNRIFKSFHRSCFLADIKGEASGPKGLVHLQEQLLYSISKWKVDGNIENVYRGRQLIIEKLQGENVLLILDDVDSRSQLDALAIECYLFGPGSRIIITSRDKHILELAKVDEDKIYCPTELDRVQSLQLFNLHAFSSDRSPEEYLQLSLDVTILAGGLPLTLEVLGSTFSDKENREEVVWKSMLQELKRIPHDEVFEKLKISYDSLTDHEKSIFLDAACFFVGRQKESLISVWDACGFNPILAIKKLTQRSLLKFIPTSDYGKTYDVLRMHDQIQAMGRHIVRKESPTEPSKWSRLWSYEDILKVLEEPEGAQMLEVIYKRQDYHQLPQPLPHRPNFAMMSKLRVLHIHEAVQSKGDFPHLPPNLRCFSWNGIRVPANFYHKKLVRMDISHTQIGEAWTKKPHNEIQRFQKLKVLILKWCDVSYKSFDFSWFPYLETLDLEWCENMVDLHKSIGDLKSLVKLNLGWTKIKELPNSICSLSTLKVLTLEGCSSLENLPESIGELKSLVKLELANTGIKELPNSICRLSSLEVLQGNVFLKNLPESIGDLKSLVKLDLANAIIEELPNSICRLSSLTVLTLPRCSLLKNLPESIGDLKSLVELELDDLIIEELPNSICHLSSLRVLTLNGCFALKNLPESIGDLKSLVKLDLGFTNIEEIPSSICKLSSLTWLSLQYCKSLNKLPDGVWLLEKLEELSASDCPKLVELRTLRGRMRCLRTIDLTGTMILLPRENSVMLPSLVNLYIGNDLESSLPSWISGLPRLRHLVLEGHTNLKSLPDLPSTLKSLTLKNCISLQTLPDLSSLSHLKSLHIWHCKELKEIRGLEGIVESSLEILVVMGCKYLVDTPRWKIHGQGTLLVDKISCGVNNILVDEISQGINIYSSNVNDGIYKGLSLCVVFQLPPAGSIRYCDVREGQLVDICLCLEVSIRRRKDGWIIKLSHDVVIEGVKYTCVRDIIYVHHFKGFGWFGIPLDARIDAIEVFSVNGIRTHPVESKVKFWKVFLESTASEQQRQQITYQEEESTTAAARRMVADFFNWSDDEEHERSHPIQAYDKCSDEMIDSLNDRIQADVESSDDESNDEMIDSHNDPIQADDENSTDGMIDSHNDPIQADDERSKERIPIMLRCWAWICP